MPRKKSAAKLAKEESKKQTISKEERPNGKSEELNKNIEEVEENEDDSEESSSEEEDEFGELLDKETDENIAKVIEAIRNNDEKLLDKEVKFFEDPEKAVEKIEKSSSEKNKPLYLKDYHRIRLLENGGDYDEDEEMSESLPVKKTYDEEQKEQKQKLLDVINEALKEEEEEAESDDDFLKKKEPKEADAEEEATKLKLPDPEENSDQFLEEFLNQQAWIPRTKQDLKDLNLGAIDKEEIKAEQEFDDAVESFEKVYNFRYEEANSSEIISYARNQATMRRSKMNSRKKQRIKKQEKKKEEKQKHEEKIQKKKTEKINKVMDRLAEIKQAVGNDVDDETIEKVFGDSLLNDDFDDADWDAKMNEIFNANMDGEQKPEWDEEDEIMKEVYEEVGNDEEKTSKSKRHEKIQEKKKERKEKESLKKKAESIVMSNIDKVEEEVEKEEEKESNKKELKFKYKEVEPESFGLTDKEILLAGDTALNQFVSLKKLAPYRDPDLVQRDRRKLSKKKRLREWRKETFGTEEELK